MSQRDSGYERKAFDFYRTPEWVTEALIPFIPSNVRGIREPAAGDGVMVNVLSRAGFKTYASDIAPHIGLDKCQDFFAYTRISGAFGSIVTNPPYSCAMEFIEHALRLTRPDDFVAMLLRCDFDHAKTRAHLFADCPAFTRKIVLRKRIVWFTEADGKPKASPSFNHAWYLWDWQNTETPKLSWTA